MVSISTMLGGRCVLDVLFEFVTFAGTVELNLYLNDAEIRFENPLTLPSPPSRGRGLG